MRSVLIADDNRAFAENLAEILEDAGYAAVITDTGAEALQLAAARRFDALISDMRMPEMGGAELVHAVRRMDPGLPAIVVTAYTYDNDLARARHAGLLSILPKPVPVPRLLELLSVARRDGLVALVEDEPKLSDNLSEILRMHGYSTVTAASVLETEAFGDVVPCLGLVDLRLPGGPDGEAMRRLAQRFPGLPLLVISGHADIVPPVAHAGFFLKPFNTAALLLTMEKIYNARKK